MADESIWKKEISFGRKRKEEETPESDTDVTTGSDEPTSVWKKEISFGRKKKEDAQTETPAAEAEVVPEASAEEPEPEQTWTRAVSFGRKAQPEPDAVAEEPVVDEPVAEEPAEVVELPVAAADPVGDAPPADESTWTKEVSFSRAPAEEPVVEEPIVGEPAPVVELPVAAEPVWTHEVSVSAPPVEPAPEPAEPEPEPEPEPEKKVPFWKKEIGGKRKPKEPKEPKKAKKTPKAEAEAETETAAVVEEPQSDKKVPFWKKEIGGKKKPKAERAPKQPKQPKEPKAAKAPKERKPKQPKVKAGRGSRGAKRITGLKVGASQLAAARVANNGSAELLQTARTPLEPGVVVGGELRDPDALAEALKEFFAANNLPKKGVRLGIANNRIGVRTFEIAGVDDEKQLTNAIRFRAQEALPIPIDEAVLDYQVLGDGTDEHGQPTKRILLVVAYRELIDRYLDACKKAGISLVGIDLEAFALLRALQAPQDGVGGDSAAALVAVAIGHDRSTFAVSDGRICEFTRVLEWGGSALNVAIARALDAAPSEVDVVKRALALTDEMVPEGLTDDQAKKARDAMRRAIQTFARELVSSLQYYQNQPGSLGIGEIVLTGGTAHLAGLAGELEKLIGVRVRVGDPLARMKVSKKVGEAEQVGSLAVAIGLGIED
jgi:type IV pilus assembly protein PilM